MASNALDHKGGPSTGHERLDAADDIFLGSALVFLLLIGTLWLTERPARHSGTGAVDAGGAH